MRLILMICTRLERDSVDRLKCCLHGLDLCDCQDIYLTS